MAPTQTPSAPSCRLCDESNSKMYNIFEKNVFDIEIINMIKDCLPILIYEHDPFSKFICHSCNESLNMFCEFKKCCMDICQKQHEELQAKTERTEEERVFLQKLSEEVDNRNRLGLQVVEAPFDDRYAEEEANADEAHFDENSKDDTEMAVNGNPILRREFTTPNTITMKPILVGPASKTRKCTMLVDEVQIIYQPLSLMALLVRQFNLQNIDDFKEDPWLTEEVIVSTLHHRCRYCEETHEDENWMGVHELNEHIRLELERVDDARAWNEGDEEYKVRNEWFNKRRKLNNKHVVNNDNEEADEDEDEDDDVEVGDTELDPSTEVPSKANDQLLVPLPEEESKEIRFGADRCPVYYIGNVPFVDGQELGSLLKDERNSYYMSVKVNGVKRKFCPLCRYTFKDNWAIDMHYLALACFYTCRYCGIKFKRSKPEFQPHVDVHIQSGHKLNTNVFLARDGAGSRQVSVESLESYTPMVVTTPRQPAPLPPACSMKLRERSLLIKQEPLDYLDAPPYVSTKRKRGDLTPEKPEASQAYYCKKCYQVFGKVNNYNMHIKSCNPSNGTYATSVYKSEKDRAALARNTKPMPGLAPLKNKAMPVKVKKEVMEEYESYPCLVCNSVFDSVYSRNSHMRIHTKQTALGSLPANSRNAPMSQSPPAKKMRHENYEPIVEIHEMSLPRVPSSVTIIPVKKKTNTGISEDILKLVQNNPSITLKPREPAKKQVNNALSSNHNDAYMEMDDMDMQTKSYKCSSCSTWFPNKSSLYFHKKSDCSGARYPCPFCKQRFTTPNEYSSHIFYSHPE